MQPNLKKILRALSLDLRHTLEGWYDNTSAFHPGDLETRLNALGVWRERVSKPIEELPYLSTEDKTARQVIDAYIAYRAEAEVNRADAVEEFVRESAYNWANRLLALRCMEARGIIDEVILQKEIYGGRSLVHNRLARKNPEACAGPDEGLFAMLFREFEERAGELPELFAPASPAIVLRPSLPALKRCLALLSGIQKASGQEAASDVVFSAPDALGWAYQYWNTEEKDRVFEKVRTQKGAKIEGADIIPATQLYTEPYMVKFLVQNSLGATWMNMHSDSKLAEGWEYFVKDADHAPMEPKQLLEITLLDPACGSGHFLLEAFDVFFQMYREEHSSWSEDQIVAAILNHNLYGIDIDERAVQITAAAIWMKAKETAQNLQPEDLTTFHQHLVATNIRLPKGKDHLKAFLAKHPEAAPLQPALEAIFEGLENVHELGSLVQIEEPVEKELRYLRGKYESAKRGGIQTNLFEPTVVQGALPLGVESYEQWKNNTMSQLEQFFTDEAQVANLTQAYFGLSARKGLALFDILSKHYDLVMANPPYLGSGNMSPFLKMYLASNYPGARKNLYSAFILLSTRLVLPLGYVALLTLQGWMFLSSFENLRRLLLNSQELVTIANLGPNAFDPENYFHTGVAVALLIYRNILPNNDSFFLAADIINQKWPDQKSVGLKNFAQGNYGRFSPKQVDLQALEGNIIAYKLTPSFASLLRKKTDDGEINILIGLITKNIPRFVRYFWEIDRVVQPRWTPYSKGGGYSKWEGFEYYVVDWGKDGERIAATGIAVIPSKQWYFKDGLVFSQFAAGSLSVRKMHGAIFSNASPAIFSNNSETLLAISASFNSRLASFLVRQLNPKHELEKNLIIKLPLVNTNMVRLLVQVVHNLKSSLNNRIITERFLDIMTFRCSEPNLTNSVINFLWDDLITSTKLHMTEGILEKILLSEVDISIQETQNILEETGIPSGWLPLLPNYDSLLGIFDGTDEISTQLANQLETHERCKLSASEINQKISQLRSYFEKGHGNGKTGEMEKENMENEEGEEPATNHVPIPSETFIEELSQKMQLHPVSIYWLLKEGIEKKGWHSKEEEKRVTEDIFTVLILRILGHRWPKQTEAGEPIPDWADLDGIVPLTPALQEPALLERVRVRLPQEFHDGKTGELEREFEEITGESLGKWIGSNFFKHHISQFKKRPIAWQLSSHTANGAGGKGKKKGLDKAPAFSCLVYYHKLDHNTLTTLQSQYIRPLRQSYETELRTLDNSTFLTRTKSSRRIQLEAWIDELNDFKSRLAQCAREGFASPTLKDIAGKEPLDRWTSRDGQTAHPVGQAEFEAQEMRFDPDINDGVRVNIAPLQKYGLLAMDVLDVKDIEKAIADRAEWRADERRWCRDGKLPQPGWWK